MRRQRSSPACPCILKCRVKHKTAAPRRARLAITLSRGKGNSMCAAIQAESWLPAATGPTRRNMLRSSMKRGRGDTRQVIARAERENDGFLEGLELSGTVGFL